MCRSKLDGGRRCPCSDPVRRAAKRNADKALKLVTKESSKPGVTKTVDTVVNTLTMENFIAETEQVQKEVKALIEAGEYEKAEQVSTEHGKKLNALIEELSSNFVYDELGTIYDYKHLLSKEVVSAVSKAQSVEKSFAVNLAAVKEILNQYSSQKRINSRARIDKLKEQISSDCIDEIETYRLRLMVNEFHNDHLGEDKLNELAEEIDKSEYVQLSKEDVLAMLKPNLEQHEVRQAYEELMNSRNRMLHEVTRNTAYLVKKLNGEHEKELNFVKGSNKAVVDSLNEAVKFYPKEWVEHSANTHKILAKNTTRRASYNVSGGSEEKTMRAVVAKEAIRGHLQNGFAVFESLEVGVESEPIDYLSGGGDSFTKNKGKAVSRLMSTVEKKTVDGKEEYIVRNYRVTVPDENGELRAHKTHSGYKMLKDTMARTRVNRDFHAVSEPIIKVDLNANVNEFGEKAVTPDGIVYYREPAELVMSTDVVSKITTSSDQSINPVSISADSRFRASIHELSHSFEQTQKGVSELERAFYSRRTKGEQPVSVSFAPEKERFRLDNFVSYYMGRDYDHERNSVGKSFELLSTSMETLFVGQNNCFYGNTNKHADMDMRTWALGVLSTVR